MFGCKVIQLEVIKKKGRGYPKYWASTLAMAKDYGLSHDYIMEVVEELLPKIPISLQSQFHPDVERGVSYYGMDRGAFGTLAVELGGRLLATFQKTSWHLCETENHRERKEIRRIEDAYKERFCELVKDILCFGPGKQFIVATEEEFHQMEGKV